MTRISRILLASLVAAIAAPASAHGATVTLASGTATFTAASGEANQVTVEYAGKDNEHIDFTDTGVSQMTAGLGCTNQPGERVRCPRTSITALVLDLGDGNDNLSNQVLTSATVYGGFGNDTIISGYGNDSVSGGPGNDSVNGSWGNDVIDGGDGADSMTGSFGTDRVTYAARTVGVSVTLDGVANDGAAGEGDNVDSSVNNVTGGAGNDSLTGSTTQNELAGGDGDDTLAGGDGDDTLRGGLGHDSFDGGAGADSLFARDGIAETLACGSEADTAEADYNDSADAGCEVVNRDEAPPAPPEDPSAPPVAPQPEIPPAPTGGTGNVIEAPVATIPSAPVAVSADGVAAVRLKCPSEAFEGCAGSIVIETLGATGKGKVEAARRRKTKAKAKRLGSRRFKVAAGQGATIPVRLDRRNWRKYKKRKRVKVQITVTMQNATGTTTNTRTVTLKPAPPKKRGR